MVDLIDEITKAVDEEKYAVSIFLDLSKAFDTVNHSILLSKLDLYGIRGNENQWFRSYLSNRKQKVFVNGVESNFLLLNSGVPLSFSFVPDSPECSVLDFAPASREKNLFAYVIKFSLFQASSQFWTVIGLSAHN